MAPSVLHRLGIIGTLLVLPAAASWRGGLFSAGATSQGDPARLIAALNGCIQQRFREINERFGISRVIRIGDTPHTFRPEEVAELEAVTALEQAGLHVVLYLAGRRVQTAKPDTSRWSAADAWRLIKGPVRVTSDGAASTGGAAADPIPPPPLELWDDSRRALKAFATSDLHEFDRGGWRFIAKPVRASEAACLKCHDQSQELLTRGGVRSEAPKLGDPLGVVLYGYQSR
jgi:hypothetical protein